VGAHVPSPRRAGTSVTGEGAALDLALEHGGAWLR